MATTASLLRETYGPRRRLVCAIDGLQELIWQDDGTGVAPTRPARGSPDVTDLVALEPPADELSWGIDIGEMSVKPSAMTIAFRNVEDPTDSTQRFFVNLFAPGRHASPAQKSVHLDRTSAVSPYVLADETTITVKGDNSAWTTPGYAYTSRETFSYTGVTGATFTGCSRGLWSCVGLAASSWATTYKVPDYNVATAAATSPLLGIEISTAPYSWIGRRIALHAVAYDDSIGAWRTNVDMGDGSVIDGKLTWIGRINSIRYNGQRGTWELGCEHILADLEEKICVGMPKMRLNGLNMNGSYGMGFEVLAYTSSTLDQVSVAIASGVYATHDSLAAAISTKLGPVHGSLKFDGEKYALQFFNYLGSDAEFRVMNWASWSSAGGPLGQYMCHGLNALGFGFAETLTTGTVSGGDVGYIVAEGPPALAYTPLADECNGGRIYTTSLDPSDVAGGYDGTQTDGFGANNAAAEIGNAVLAGKYPDPEDKGTFHFRYSSKTTTSFTGSTGTTGTLVTLADTALDGLWAGKYLRVYSYAAQWLGEEPCEVRNVLIPNRVTPAGIKRGPFELLLYPMLSTGTASNSDIVYDSLPYEMGAAMDGALVDKQSFLDADQDIIGNDLAYRCAYVISDISWMDLLQRECKLFGYVLGWDASQSKLSLRSTYIHDLSSYTVTVSDSNGIDPSEFPDVDISTDTVINRWELSIQYDRKSGKYDSPIVVEDEDSIQQLRTAKTVKVQHPGVWLEDSVVGAVDQIVKDLFTQNRYCWRYPWQVVTKTLAPFLAGRISVGDVVQFTSDRIPDPYGSGTMSTSVLALVLDVSWNLTTWAGKCTLLLYSGYDAALVTPWAWSCVATVWNAGTGQLTVTAKTWGAAADSDDAAEAQAGDFVDIIERNPADPTAAQHWHNLELAYDYTSGLLEFVGSVTLTGWDAAKEYIVVPSLYSSVATAQKTENAFIGAASTGLLGSDPAHRYG